MTSFRGNFLREDFKYYFADFVRKGGGGTPQIRKSLFAEKKSVKGGGGTPKSETPFLSEKKREGGGGVYPPYGQNPQSSI